MTSPAFDSPYAALARRLVLVLGLGAGACGGNQPLPPAAPASESAPARAALESAAEDDLARLRALSLVEVRDLVLGLPDASSACYGSPCLPDAWEVMVTEAYRRQVPRLDALTTIAERVVREAYAAGDARAAPRDLAALDGLGIVDLGALLEAQPANNPTCYNTPCSQDVADARALTSRRAGWVHDWATLAVAARP